MAWALLEFLKAMALSLFRVAMRVGILMALLVIRAASGLVGLGRR